MDIDRDKLAAVLSELMTERRRRQEARGEVAEVRIVGIPPDDMDDGDDGDEDTITCVITGVPDPDPEPEQRPAIVTSPPQVRDEIEPVARYEGLDVPRTYVYSVLRQASETHNGIITEGYYCVSQGELTVEDTRGEVIGTATLHAGDDPLRVARLLLLEGVEQEDIPIAYPNIRLA